MSSQIIFIYFFFISYGLCFFLSAWILISKKRQCCWVFRCIFFGTPDTTKFKRKENCDSYIQNRWINRTRGLKIDAFDFRVNIYLLQCPYNRKAWTSESRMTNRCVQHDFMLPITMFQTVTMVPYLILLTVYDPHLHDFSSLWHHCGGILVQSSLEHFFRSFRFVGVLLFTAVFRSHHSISLRLKSGLSLSTILL